jgi:hypothetical protein
LRESICQRWRQRRTLLLPSPGVLVVGHCRGRSRRRRGLRLVERQAPHDGAQVDPAAIPLVDDGRIHDVQIVLGDVTQLDPGWLAGRSSARAPQAK